MNNKVHTGFPTPKKNYYKVYVNSNTYNQAPYIVDCLNGVAMQRSDFPLVHHVHVIDDCSTDGKLEFLDDDEQRKGYIFLQFYESSI